MLDSGCCGEDVQVPPSSHPDVAPLPFSTGSFQSHKISKDCILYTYILLSVVSVGVDSKVEALMIYSVIASLYPTHLKTKH
jgi:hypothetical protein